MKALAGSGWAGLLFLFLFCAAVRAPAGPHIFMITGNPDLTRVVTEVSEPSMYGIARFIQLSPTRAALVANLKQVELAVVDLEAGSDLIPFDSLEDICASNAIPLVRNHETRHPRQDINVLMVKYPTLIGFVPLGARLDDGTPHPAAGRGFGLTFAQGYPTDHSDLMPHIRQDLHKLFQWQQYRYDGKDFLITEDRFLDPNEIIPGWKIKGNPLGGPLPDGPDFLVPLVAGRSADEGSLQGLLLVRMRYEDGSWKVGQPLFVEGSERGSPFEPSLVRDRDGSLLMSARRGYHWFVVWQSLDNGQTWRLIMEQDAMRSHSPVTINRTPGGAPFLCANPYIEPSGVGLAAGLHRNKIAIWPLTADRRGVKEPTFLHDFNRARFGSGPGGSRIRADHPVSAVVRLADGQWRTLMSLRLLARDEHHRVFETPMSGTWVKEVVGLQDGPVIPEWRF